MRSKSLTTVISNAALFGCGGLAVYLLVEQDALNVRFAYAVLTVLLMVYLWLEVVRIRRNHPERWLLNPAVICALMTFVMGYGLTNVLFFMPPESIEFLGLVPDVSSAMVKHQYLVLIGALMLFLGYWSPLATGLTRPRIVAQFQRRYLPGTDVLKGLAIPILLGIAVVVRLYAMSKGLYGYGGDYSAERLAVTSAYSQYLSMAGGLGKLALVLAALRYFTPGSRLQNARWFWAALLIEVFFGFLSGMKSAVGMPIVIAGLCLYLRTGNIPKSWIALTIASIVVAYAVIEPFRMVRNQQGGALTSVSAIVDVLDRGMRSDNPAKPKNEESGSTFLTVAARSNLSYIGSFGLDYADAHPELPEGSPAFLQDLLLAPLHALIPRFIWDSKPLGQLGLWYNQVVMGMSHFSATAMGPFVYLYFAGGYLAVGIAFFFIGVLQRTLLFLMTPWERQAGAVAFLAMLGPLANVDSAVNGIIINMSRDVILVLLVLHFLYRRGTQRVRTPSSIMPRGI